MICVLNVSRSQINIGFSRQVLDLGIIRRGFPFFNIFKQVDPLFFRVVESFAKLRNTIKDLQISGIWVRVPAGKVSCGKKQESFQRKVCIVPTIVYYDFLASVLSSNSQLALKFSNALQKVRIAGKCHDLRNPSKLHRRL
jgi:hypothetical protein